MTPSRTNVGIATGLCIAAMLAMPAGALADCQPVDSVEAALESAEVAFVGTVLQTAPGEGAVFRVEEAWVGELGATIEVSGLNSGRAPRVIRPNQEGPAVAPAPVGLVEDDRVWEIGQRYLVIPYVVGGQLVDHICSGTVPWTDELAALRPPGAVPADAATTSGSRPWPLLIAAAIALVMAAAGWLAFRSREHSR